MANTIDIILRMGGAAQVQRELKAVQSAFHGIQASWQSVTGLLAATGVTAAFKAMLKAAEESRVATFQLAQALNGVGGRGMQKALEAQASALQQVTGTSDETTMAVQRLLIEMGATIEQVGQLTPLVLDVAAAMGTDATTAARQLGQALDGQDIQLGRLNIKVKSFGELMGILNERFAGQAKALAEARGPMLTMQTSIDDMKESLGHLTAWSSDPIISELAKLSRTAANLFDPNVNPGLAAFAGMALRSFGTANNLAAFNPVFSSAANWFTGTGGSPGSPTFGRGGRAAFGGGMGGFDEESAAINAEIARQASASQALLQVHANLNNQYAFRKALIESDPFMGEVERQEALARVMRDELPTLQEREDLLRAEFDRQLRADPGRTLETTIEAERELTEAQLERLRITQRIEAIGQSGTFGGALRAQVRALRDEFGNLAVNMARVTFNTVTAGVEGLSTALTSIITGAQSAAQAFAAFGRAMLSQFISSILTAVLYAKVAIPILTALGVVSGGATAATGAGVTTAALASGMAAAQAATSGGFAAGGYTGDGPVNAVAGPVHRGEFVVPAPRVRELGVANLEAMTFGGGSAGGGDPMRVVIVDDRRSAQQLMRDPRFRSFVVDLAQS